MTTERTFHQWRDYVADGRTRGETGRRILEAYAAGYTRQQIGWWLGCSPGYVSRLASIARTVALQEVRDGG